MCGLVVDFNYSECWILYQSIRAYVILWAAVVPGTSPENQGLSSFTVFFFKQPNTWFSTAPSRKPWRSCASSADCHWWPVRNCTGCLPVTYSIWWLVKRFPWRIREAQSWICRLVSHAGSESQTGEWHGYCRLLLDQQQSNTTLQKLSSLWRRSAMHTQRHLRKRFKMKSSKHRNPHDKVSSKQSQCRACSRWSYCPGPSFGGPHKLCSKLDSEASKSHWHDHLSCTLVTQQTRSMSTHTHNGSA